MKENIREIVFDTETTGFYYNQDDRLVEIGCIELLNHIPTGKNYHVYINPERDMPIEAFKVHGLSTEFLSTKPKFSEIVDEFLEFIGDATLIAHNAKFDINFLNAELKRVNKPELKWDRVIDTLFMSRQKDPASAKHSLDALCKKYNIDNSHRELHGALLDAQLLVEVYIELIGGKNIDFFKDLEKSNNKSTINTEINQNTKPAEKEENAIFEIRNKEINDSEYDKHQDMISQLKKDVIWKKYLNN